MRPSIRLSTALTIAGFAMLAPTSLIAADRSVAERLDSAEMKYVMDEDGDYKVTYNYSKEGRTQLVFVSGGTETVGSFEIREVFSPAGRVEKDGIDTDKALELLQSNAKYKVGAWEIRGDVLYFVMKMPESMSAGELVSAMDIAAETADDMEIELSGDRDEL